MTRPGPRPYECLRRAWHSDRHQPMRGSLIKEIFRVVSEVHSSATKKNIEWQDKLPIVVLKAEEIMYSKANSEVEYMDLKTLWDRANDAINTIIRRDESTESGQFLQHCIEAALNLGCTPRGASRNQQNNTPICYLKKPSSQEACCVPWRNSGSNTVSAIGKSYPTLQIHNGASNVFHLSPGNFTPSGSNQKAPANRYPSLNSCSVYPLHYEDHLQPNGFSIQSHLKSHTIEPGEINIVQNLRPCELAATREINRADCKDASKNTPFIGCDLSLRLGDVAAPSISNEDNLLQGMEDAGSSSSHEGSKLIYGLEKDNNLLSKANYDERLDSFSCRLSDESENLNVDATARKRKAAATDLSEDAQFYWKPKLPFNHLTRRMNNPGS